MTLNLHARGSISNVIAKTRASRSDSRPKSLCLSFFLSCRIVKLVEGDVLTHLNGRNARLLDFSDILKACRGPERGGLPRPLVMKFSRSVMSVISNLKYWSFPGHHHCKR